MKTSIGGAVGRVVGKVLVIGVVIITIYVIVHSLSQTKAPVVGTSQLQTKNSEGGTNSRRVLSRCENLSGLERHTCYILEMEKTRDPSICAEIDSDSMRKNCYNFYRFEINPVEECPKILNEDERINCYSYGGIVTKNISLCDKIEVGDLRRDVCYVGNALYPENYSRYSQRLRDYTFGERYGLCEAVNDTDMRIYCLAALTKNEMLCDSILGEFRNSKCLECVSSLKDCSENETRWQCYYICETGTREWETTTGGGKTGTIKR